MYRCAPFSDRVSEAASLGMVASVMSKSGFQLRISSQHYKTLLHGLAKTEVPTFEVNPVQKYHLTHCQVTTKAFATTTNDLFTTSSLALDHNIIWGFERSSTNCLTDIR